MQDALTATEAESYPLSSEQEFILLAEQGKPGTTLSKDYVIASAFRIRGHIDTLALNQAFQYLVDSHDVLRTTIAAADGAPCQLVGPKCSADIERHDHRDVAIEDRDRVAWQAAHEALRRGVPYVSPLARVELFELADDDAVFSFLVHESVADAWSVGVLLRRLSEAYAAIRAGRDPAPVPGAQYVEHALRQQALRAESAASLDYWRGALSELPTFELPGGCPKTGEPLGHGRVSLALDAELVSAVNRCARELRMTPTMFTAAAMVLVLHEVTDSDDVFLPVILHGRDHLKGKDSESMVGMFLNAMLLRSKAKRTQTSREFLRGIRETCLSGYRHLDISIMRVIEVLPEVPAILANPRFVWIGFQFLPEWGRQLTLSGVETAFLNVTSDTEGAASFPLDLEFTVTWSDDGAICAVTYNREMFDRDTANDIVQRYANAVHRCLSLDDLVLRA